MNDEEDGEKIIEASLCRFESDTVVLDRLPHRPESSLIVLDYPWSFSIDSSRSQSCLVSLDRLESL